MGVRGTSFADNRFWNGMVPFQNQLGDTYELANPRLLRNPPRLRSHRLRLRALSRLWAVAMSAALFS